LAHFRGQSSAVADRDTRTPLTVYDWAKAASFLIHLRNLEEIESIEGVEEEPIRPKLAKTPSLATIDEEPRGC
jgi:hypothetical protein